MFCSRVLYYSHNKIRSLSWTKNLAVKLEMEFVLLEVGTKFLSANGNENSLRAHNVYMWLGGVRNFSSMTTLKILRIYNNIWCSSFSRCWVIFTSDLLTCNPHIHFSDIFSYFISSICHSVFASVIFSYSLYKFSILSNIKIFIFYLPVIFVFSLIIFEL
jgi:hypothetical protein